MSVFDDVRAQIDALAASARIHHKPPTDAVAGRSDPPANPVPSVSDTAGRDPRTGRFTTGAPGRRPGSLNKKTLLKRALAAEMPRLATMLYGDGWRRDPDLLRIAAKRLLPPRSGALVRMHLPELATVAAADAACAEILQMMSQAVLSPSEAKTAYDLVDRQRRKLLARERAPGHRR